MNAGTAGASGVLAFSSGSASSGNSGDAAWHGCSHGRPQRVDLFHRARGASRRRTLAEAQRQGANHVDLAEDRNGVDAAARAVAARAAAHGERDQPAAAFRGCTRAKPPMLPLDTLPDENTKTTAAEVPTTGGPPRTAIPRPQAAHSSSYDTSDMSTVNTGLCYGCR